jgi:hypothetical protein
VDVLEKKTGTRLGEVWLDIYRHLLLTVHRTENPIYVFQEMKLCGLIPNSFIHVSVSDLHTGYIPRFGLPIWLQQNRQTDPGNI